MRVLLDTHALLWWFAGHRSLSSTARRIVSQSANTVIVSAASAWEISTKFRIGKLPDGGDLLANFEAYLEGERFERLPISTEHGVRAGLLPGPHRDPFDRMLVAQAQTENIPIVSADSIFDSFRVRRLW